MTNIAEILKNAPQGLKLYSFVHGEVTLKKVIDSNDTNYPIVVVLNSDADGETFTKYGKFYKDYEDAECVLFPSKKHKSWDNWQDILFQCGDVVVSQNETPVGFQIFLCYENDNRGYLAYGVGGEKNYITPSYYRYATLEEREQFMTELNANGYKWNADTKQIEKIEQQYTPKYKVDDLIINNNGNICDVKKVNEIVTYKDNSIHYRLYNLNSRCIGDYQLKDIDSNFRLVTEEEKAKLISRGDIEKPFTIDDLKPFDKVLVRDNYDSHWEIELFAQYDTNIQYICLTCAWRYCIPYNDETKHLLGTKNDCPKKYKTW